MSNQFYDNLDLPLLELPPGLADKLLERAMTEYPSLPQSLVPDLFSATETDDVDMIDGSTVEVHNSDDEEAEDDTPDLVHADAVATAPPGDVDIDDGLSNKMETALEELDYFSYELQNQNYDEDEFYDESF